MFKRNLATLTFSLFLASAAGCGGALNTDDPELLGADGKEDGIGSTSTYYSVSPDMRRCASPMCGGYFVSRVNQTLTTCADGQRSATCYVAALDFAALGLTDAESKQLYNLASAKQALFRGHLVQKRYATAGTFGVLKVTEGWQAASDDAPTGSFYALTDSGIRCFTTPCSSLHEGKLNSTVGGNIADLVGSFGDKAASAYAQYGRILAAGTNVTERSGAKALSVTQFYTPFVHVDPLACSTDDDCTVTAYYKPVNPGDACYCARCANTVLNTSAAAANQASYEAAGCMDAGVICPAILCQVPPNVACIAHVCTAQEMPL
jgi:hypothetical protein